jgi:hypothetical protein
MPARQRGQHLECADDTTGDLKTKNRDATRNSVKLLTENMTCTTIICVWTVWTVQDYVQPLFSPFRRQLRGAPGELPVGSGADQKGGKHIIAQEGGGVRVACRVERARCAFVGKWI